MAATQCFSAQSHLAVRPLQCLVTSSCNAGSIQPKPHYRPRTSAIAALRFQNSLAGDNIFSSKAGISGQPRQKYFARTVQATANSTTGVKEFDVVVVGAGLAGLSCTQTLAKAGVDYALLEAADDVGGRVRTDKVDGFLLDRGFQIFLSGYPECRSALDYDALGLGKFYAGAMVRYNGSFHRVADPFRHPLEGVASLANPIGTFVDKLKIGLVRLQSLQGDALDLLEAPETTIAARLQEIGFSDSMVERFFRPFLGGIFFDRKLRTTSRLFHFVIRMLATGDNCLPAQGIGAITQQIKGRLDAKRVYLNTPAVTITGTETNGPATVTTRDGTKFIARKGVIVAVESPVAKKLLGSRLPPKSGITADPVGTVCMYFAAKQVPSTEPILYLNGEGDDDGLINNLCFPSTVSPAYAPQGQHLVSLSLIGNFTDLSDTQLEAKVRAQLSRWFGDTIVAPWELLRLYRIPFSQPNQQPPSSFGSEPQLGNGLYICGDYCGGATFNGAMISGRQAAEAVIKGN
eukprot:jgi/Mesvir1/19285/Mv10360-RA.1